MWMFGNMDVAMISITMKMDRWMGGWIGGWMGGWLCVGEWRVGRVSCRCAFDHEVCSECIDCDATRESMRACLRPA